MFKAIGDFFGHVGNGLAHAWNEVVNKNVVPALGVAVHFGLGAVAGGVTSYIMSGGVLTPSGLIYAGVTALITASVKLADASQNNTVSGIAQQITPAIQQQISSAVTAQIQGAVGKMKR